MGRRRILMLITNTGFGGAERSFSNVCSVLAEEHDVHACTFTAWEPGHHPVPVPLHELKGSRGTTPLGKMRRLQERVRSVRRLKRELGVDLCISFLEGADYVNVLSRGNERVVLSVRGSKMFDENIAGPLGVLRQRFLIPLVLRRPDAIVALSEGVGSELRAQYRVPPSIPIHVIPNFFDGSRIAELAAAPVSADLNGLYEERDVLVSHGRLSREKGLRHLLDVLRVLRLRRPRTALLLVGDGPERGRLLAQANAYGLSAVWLPEHPGGPVDADVVLTGHDNNPFRYLRRARMFVLASSAEGFGNSIVEAMMTELPAVCVDCPYGPREILAPGTGRPVEITAPEFAAHGVLMPTFHRDGLHSRAVETWADTLEQLLLDEPLRRDLARRGRKRCDDFRHDAIGAQWRRAVDSITRAGITRANERTLEVLQ